MKGSLKVVPLQQMKRIATEADTFMNKRNILQQQNVSEIERDSKLAHMDSSAHQCLSATLLNYLGCLTFSILLFRNDWQ